MDAKRLVMGTVVGGVVLYAVGWLIFTKAFAAFYAANAGSATGVDRSTQILWAVLLGNFAYATLITYAMGNRAGSLSIGEGAMTGAIVGFLIWATADFILFGVSNTSNLTKTIVDPLLEIVHGGVAGAVIAAMLRRVPATSLSTA
jgi:hypothetical protein